MDDPEYKIKVNEAIDDFINHGYGRIVIEISSLKDDRVSVRIECGRHYRYLVNKKFKPFSKCII